MSITDISYHCTNSPFPRSTTYCNSLGNSSVEAFQRFAETQYSQCFIDCVAKSQDLAREAGLYKTALFAIGIIGAISAYNWQRSRKGIEKDIDE